MNEWTIIAQGSAIAIAVRMVCFLNLMKSGRVPQRCILGVLVAGVGAVGIAFAPWHEGIQFSWPTAVFAACVAAFVWTDRRRPTRAPVPKTAIIEDIIAGSARYVDASERIIECDVKFRHLPHYVRFSASLTDERPLARSVFILCEEGAAGEVMPYDDEKAALLHRVRRTQ